MTGAWRAFAGLMLGVGLAMPQAAVAAPNPQKAQQMVRETTRQMLEVLRRDPEGVENEIAWLRRRMEEILAPTLDFVTMTKLAVGPGWLKASEEQKRALVKEFHELLLRTYARSLHEYSNQKIKFLPLKPSGHPRRVTVRSRLIQAQGPEIAINYRLRYDEGEWSVYDITVEGVSLVTNYRSTFATLIREQGVDALIERLRRKNAQTAATDSAS